MKGFARFGQRLVILAGLCILAVAIAASGGPPGPVQPDPGPTPTQPPQPPPPVAPTQPPVIDPSQPVQPIPPGPGTTVPPGPGTIPPGPGTIPPGPGTIPPGPGTIPPGPGTIPPGPGLQPTGPGVPIPGAVPAAPVTTARAGVDPVVIAVILGFLGLVALGLHIFIAVWMAKDAARKGRSSVGWAIFGAVPLIGLIGLFIYALLPAVRQCRHGVPLAQGQTECPQCVQERYEQEARDREQQRIRAEQQARPAVPRETVVPPDGPMQAPIMDRRRTMALKPKVGTTIMLIQIGGQRHGRTVEITTKDFMGNPIRNKVGAGRDCAVPIPEDEAASSDHCVIHERDGEILVTDTASLNGTFVLRAGQQIPVHQSIGGSLSLADGDVLRVGHTDFRVIIARPPEEEVWTPGAPTT